MSNLSILKRMEDALAACANGRMARAAFVDFLGNSIRALEGVPMSVMHELRQHEYAVETEGYLDEEGFESRQDSVKKNLSDWIRELKRIHGG